MRNKVRVTLEIDYDTNDVDHPSTWDWPTLLDISHTDIVITDVLDMDSDAEWHDDDDVEETDFDSLHLIDSRFDRDEDEFE